MSSSLLHKYSTRAKTSCGGVRGFTLIELVVAIAIIALMSGLIIFEYAKFDSQLLLRNMAYEIALELREAQVRSISVRGDSGVFDALYGVHFDSANPSTYILFRDDDDFSTGGDGYSDAAEELNTYRMTRGASISAICTTEGTSETCGSSLDISFKRPDPDAIFYPASGNGTNVSSARIEIQSPRDAALRRSIVITKTGQISVQ